MDFDTLAADTDFLCGTDSTSYPLTDKARNMNRHYYLAILDILKTDDRFQWDDVNNTGQPVSKFTLVDQQQDYSLPTNLLKLYAIEVQDAAGNWKRLREIDKSQLLETISDYQKTPGLPIEYDLDGVSAKLYPSPATGSVTLTDGGRMHFSRDVDAFTSGDHTQKPGIPTPFHKILSLGAAYDWLLVNGTTEKADRMLRDQSALRKELTMFYSDRNKDTKTIIRPAHRVENYM